MLPKLKQRSEGPSLTPGRAPSAVVPHTYDSRTRGPHPRVNRTRAPASWAGLALEGKMESEVRYHPPTPSRFGGGGGVRIRLEPAPRDSTPRSSLCLVPSSQPALPPPTRCWSTSSWVSGGRQSGNYAQMGGGRAWPGLSGSEGSSLPSYPAKWKRGGLLARRGALLLQTMKCLGRCSHLCITLEHPRVRLLQHPWPPVLSLLGGR